MGKDVVWPWNLAVSGCSIEAAFALSVNEFLESVIIPAFGLSSTRCTLVRSFEVVRIVVKSI